MPPPSDPPTPELSLAEIVDLVGLYPIEAYEFVQQGLSFTVERAHGATARPKQQPSPEEGVSRHVDGRQLCHGLREYALMNWGMLARTVLSRWNIRRTLDFGRIVFALVDHGHMQKTDDDTVEDFRDVYDFAGAFEAGYRIEQKTP
ncbi:MAG: hypothetical protein H0T11_02340 [Chthoniobacterales bacterium]|nr:hypothetical protein [Chthoniobacterales bacterium]